MAKTATAVAQSAQTAGWCVINTGYVDPDDLIIDMADNGRKYPGDVPEMVVSLLNDGQKHPICVRRSERPEDKGRFRVVFGFRRALAGVEIISQGLKKDFQLRYELVDVGDAEAFLANLAENGQREDLSDIDHAYNIAKVKEQFGMDQKAIAKRLGKSTAWVSQTLKLLKLSGAEQRKVAQYKTSGGTKGIAPATAYELAELEPEERAARLAEMESEGGRVTRNKLRKKKRATTGEEHKARSSKEIRLVFEEVLTRLPDGEKPGKVEEFCREMVKWCLGRGGDKLIIKRLRDLLG